ncbi:MAG: DUF86 domain-containing protein [Aquificae bacterium]|nr:DUF86 domain-containing protein [Aquificota bacterium]
MLIHNYWGIDIEIIISILNENLPELENFIKKNDSRFKKG